MVQAESLVLIEDVLVVEPHLLEEQHAKFALMFATMPLAAAKAFPEDRRMANERCKVRAAVPVALVDTALHLVAWHLGFHGASGSYRVVYHIVAWHGELGVVWDKKRTSVIHAVCESWVGIAHV